jgi:hypothetical protein
METGMCNIDTGRYLEPHRCGDVGGQGVWTGYGSRHPHALDHPRTFDPLYSYRNLLVTTPVTFFINTCRDRIARPADLWRSRVR